MSLVGQSSVQGNLKIFWMLVVVEKSITKMDLELCFLLCCKDGNKPSLGAITQLSGYPNFRDSVRYIEDTDVERTLGPEQFPEVARRIVSFKSYPV